MGLENAAMYRPGYYGFPALVHWMICIKCELKYGRVRIEMKYYITKLPKLSQRKRYNMGCPFSSTVQRRN
jgi:hypothetical protein